LTPTSAQQHAAEYRALRATIRERGTARVVLVPIVFIGWAGIAVATAAVITVALSTLVPLLVLAAGFEALFALHVGVERIGRYLQVFHEAPGRGWEHVLTEVAARDATGRADPLFGRLFVFAASVNFFPAALGGAPAEAGIVALFHLLFIYRVRAAQRAAAAGHAEDLRTFVALREARNGSEQDPLAGRPTP
jgi:hypothetical protein